MVILLSMEFKELINVATIYSDQVWHYDEGQVTHVGIGHTGDITGVRISSNGQYIVSVSDDGAIFRWKFPVPPSPSATTINHGIGSTHQELPTAGNKDKREEPKIEEATQKQEE